MDRMQTPVHRVEDFQVTGAGDAPAWEKATWLSMSRVGGEGNYVTRVKVVYSKSGIYFLYDCGDRILNCTITEDFHDIFTEDVVELFIWTDERHPVYFEYELSPLNVELPILVPNQNGSFMGWRPWHYDDDRRTRHATAVRGGKKESKAKIEGWLAEFFIPFKLLTGLGNTPPQPGTKWRANMYRIDYDATKPTHWAWCHHTGIHFHDFKGFGTLVFE
jgi:hypothetical protein